MIDLSLDNAIASNKSYGDLATQHALFTRLRQQDPVHWTEPDGFRPFWTVTKHADLLEVERQQEAGIADLARRAVDELLAQGPALDFYQQVAVWFPLRVIMMILGLPASDEAKLLRITQAYFGGSDPKSGASSKPTRR